MSEDNEKLFGDKKIPPRVMTKRLWHYIGPEWKSFALAFLLIMINVGLDDYGQQYFLEYVEDGVLKEAGCGAYNEHYMEEIEYLFGSPTQCVVYSEHMPTQCAHRYSHGYCAHCPNVVPPDRREQFHHKYPYKI